MRTGLLILLSLFACTHLRAQCPPNIGFEDGTLDKWICYAGIVDGRGAIQMNPTSPREDIHGLLQSQSPQEKDFYGGFPVNCPNGSGFTLKLSNNTAGAKAVGVSYEFMIPPGENDYSIIYNYAVVFQDPDHQDFEQPRFFTKVFNVTDNQYLDCSAFQFIADAQLPGFKESPVEKQVYYKDWAPITVRLAGLAGKTIRLEFTVNDCTRGVHFGYAYLDINENCGSPITGNNFCAGAGSVTLSSPFGFRAYQWSTADFATKLGNSPTLTIAPAPTTNTKYALIITPFPGQGCLDTIYTTVTSGSVPLALEVVNSITGCSSPGVDITAASITNGSSNGLSFAYYTDNNATQLYTTPRNIDKSGTYFIKATNSAGCSLIKPIDVQVKKAPVLKINQPAPVCNPGKVNLTLSSITAGSEPGLLLSYWTDAKATKILVAPDNVGTKGTYYIKAAATNGCDVILPVQVNFGDPPNASFRNLSACGKVSLGTTNPTLGSDPSIVFSYWLDAATTQSIPNNHVFTASTDYYIKAQSPTGCQILHKARATVYLVPEFTLATIAPVTLPAVIDLTAAVQPSNLWRYSYWTDSATSKPFLQPNAVMQSGKYFIKAQTDDGCTVVKSVQTTVQDPEIIPPNAFSPNGDGIHDDWQIPILQYYPTATVEVFGRSGLPVYQSVGYQIPWNGKKNGHSLPFTTYYYVIKLSSQHKPFTGSVTLLR